MHWHFHYMLYLTLNITAWVGLNKKYLRGIKITIPVNMESCNLRQFTVCVLAVTQRGLDLPIHQVYLDADTQVFWKVFGMAAFGCTNQSSERA